MEELHYSGKPLAYFDQNILSLLAQNFAEDHNVYDFFRNNYQVVYSDITLDEIYRASLNSSDLNNCQKYLKILERLDANHIRIAYTTNFIFLNQCVISTAPVSQWFDKYVENKNEWGFWDNHIYNQFLLNYQKDKKIEEIKLEALQAYEKNLTQMKIAKNKLHAFPQLKEQAELMFKQVNDQKEIYEKSIDFMLSNIQEYFENEKMSERFRSEIGVYPKQLNNITTPNAMEKIWNLYKEKEVYKNFSLHDFWGITLNEKQIGRELYDYEKVNIFYNMMNFIGYHQDTKLDQVAGVQRSIGDFSHAKIASFCHFLFTDDKKLKIKTEAIYEYLGIATKFGNINIINEKAPTT